MLQNEHRAVFVISEVYRFLLRKSMLLKILYWKERKLQPVVARRVDREILFQSRVLFSNNFLK